MITVTETTKIDARLLRLEKRLEKQKIKREFNLLPRSEKEIVIDTAVNVYLERYCKHVHTKSTKRELSTCKLLDYRTEAICHGDESFVDIDLSFVNFDFKTFKRQGEKTIYILDNTFKFNHTVRIEFDNSIQVINELKAVIAKVTGNKNRGISFHRFADILTSTLKNR